MWHCCHCMGIRCADDCTTNKSCANRALFAAVRKLHEYDNILVHWKRVKLALFHLLKLSNVPSQIMHGLVMLCNYLLLCRLLWALLHKVLHWSICVWIRIFFNFFQSMVMSRRILPCCTTPTLMCIEFKPSLPSLFDIQWHCSNFHSILSFLPLCTLWHKPIHR